MIKPLYQFITKMLPAEDESAKVEYLTAENNRILEAINTLKRGLIFGVADILETDATSDTVQIDILHQDDNQIVSKVKDRLTWLGPITKYEIERSKKNDEWHTLSFTISPIDYQRVADVNKAEALCTQMDGFRFDGVRCHAGFEFRAPIGNDRATDQPFLLLTIQSEDGTAYEKRVDKLRRFLAGESEITENSSDPELLENITIRLEKGKGIYHISIPIEKNVLQCIENQLILKEKEHEMQKQFLALYNAMNVVIARSAQSEQGSNFYQIEIEATDIIANKIIQSLVELLADTGLTISLGSKGAEPVGKWSERLFGATERTHLLKVSTQNEQSFDIETVMHSLKKAQEAVRNNPRRYCTSERSL